MRILGLDISKNSSGYCIWEDGEFIAGNHHIEVGKNEELRFIKIFNSLRSFLEDLVSGKKFDYVIVEDIYFESNVDTFRVLSGLSLVPDMLFDTKVLDTEVYEKKLPSSWMSILYKLDPDSKGLKSKSRIQKILNSQGFYFDGDGSEDRYDALGIVVSKLIELGYYGNIETNKKSSSSRSKSKIRLKDLQVGYFLFEGQRDDFIRENKIDKDDIVIADMRRLSSKKLIEMCEESEGFWVASRKTVSLGSLVEDLGLTPLIGGGYLIARLKT